MMTSQRKIAVAVTGASGSIYAKLLLQALDDKGWKDNTALVFSSNAKTVWREETQDESYEKLPFQTYDYKDYYAPFASGSSDYDTLIIIPCSMGTLGKIASSISDNLITRAADVMLKERRKLICVVRETPYNLIHIDNMKRVTEAGGIIMPASPSFYQRPQTLEALVMTVVNRIMKIAAIDNSAYKWGTDNE